MGMRVSKGQREPRSGYLLKRACGPHYTKNKSIESVSHRKTPTHSPHPRPSYVVGLTVEVVVVWLCVVVVV